ncbi:methyltransferase domain-containing protein [Microcoleus sp. FACHB-1]|nr:methyltransferase domain-containing protein [Microcoleus sp. FACHB-1]
MQQVMASIASESSLVVEIGPGHIPFALATEFVDWQTSPSLAGKTIHCLDINNDPLPYEDKCVDFIYCRHTLEDLYNPFWLCKEMSRVAKAGYIETPSPVAETCRGVDAGSPPWRGYIHHRYLVWSDEDVLTFLPKYPVIEHLHFGDEEDNMVEILNSGPLYWNTYFIWNNSLEIKLIQHDKDFTIQTDYLDILAEAMQKSVENNLNLALHYNFILSNKA